MEREWDIDAVRSAWEGEWEDADPAVFFGEPLETEYRYYDGEMREDVSRRTKTGVYLEASVSADGVVFGGEPACEILPGGEAEPWYMCMEYRLFRQGERLFERVFVPSD